MSEAARVLKFGAKATDVWRTPPPLWFPLNEEFHFALDAACETHNQLAPHGLCADRGDDALLMPWHVYGGAVWCNPPYSRIRPWLEQGIRAGRIVPVVMLIPADTSTRWWFECVAHLASEVRFLVGRVRFRAADGAPHQRKGGGGSGLSTPSVLVIYRPSGGPPRYSYTETPR